MQKSYNRVNGIYILEVEEKIEVGSEFKKMADL